VGRTLLRGGTVILALASAAHAGGAGAEAQGPVPGLYRIGTGSELAYQVRHPLHVVRGTSGDVRGELRLAEAEPWLETPARIVAPLAAFSSRNRNRDSNALAALGASRHPVVALTLRGLRAAPAAHGGAAWERSGTAEADLDVQGVTRPVTVRWNASQPERDRLEVRAAFSFSLAAHGVERPALFLVPIDDRVEIESRLAAVRRN